MILGRSDLAYLDSCVYISWLTGEERDPLDVDGMTYIMKEAAKRRVVLAASVLVFAECRRVADAIDKFFDGEKARTFQVSKAIAIEAAKLGEKLGIKPPDAIHLATALQLGCGHFATFDESLAKKIVGGKLTITCGPPRILLPTYIQPTLEI